MLSVPLARITCRAPLPEGLIHSLPTVQRVSVKESTRFGPGVFALDEHLKLKLHRTVSRLRVSLGEAK